MMRDTLEARVSGVFWPSGVTMQRTRTVASLHVSARCRTYRCQPSVVLTALESRWRPLGRFELLDSLVGPEFTQLRRLLSGDVGSDRLSPQTHVFSGVDALVRLLLALANSSAQFAVC